MVKDNAYKLDKYTPKRLAPLKSQYRSDFLLSYKYHQLLVLMFPEASLAGCCFRSDVNGWYNDTNHINRAIIATCNNGRVFNPKLFIGSLSVFKCIVYLLFCRSAFRLSSVNDRMNPNLHLQ